MAESQTRILASIFSFTPVKNLNAMLAYDAMSSVRVQRSIRFVPDSFREITYIDRLARVYEQKTQTSMVQFVEQKYVWQAKNASTSSASCALPMSKRRGYDITEKWLSLCWHLFNCRFQIERKKNLLDFMDTIF